MKYDSMWLVTLNVTCQRQKVISFLDSSESNESVAKFLENLLPIVAEDTWKEKASLNNRFEAKWSYSEPNLITCGIGSPLLVARKVENMKVKMDANNRETLEYTSLKTSKTLKFIKAENGDMLSQLP